MALPKNRRVALIPVLCLLILGLAMPGLAAPGDLDPSFVVPQQHGRIARFDATSGTIDANFPFGVGFNGPVRAIVRQPLDGKFVVGGDFTEFNGVTRNRIARLNIDGTLDLTFDPGSGFSSSVSTFARVSALAVDANGDIYAGGDFTSFNSSANNAMRIAKLDNNGALVSSFSSGTGFNASVSTLALDASGNIYVGGSFITYNNTSQNRIAKLDNNGAPDVDFNSGTGFNSNVSALALDANGNVYAGGSFTSYNGPANNAMRIAKLDNNGASVGGFNTGTGFNGFINAIVIDGNDNIYIGGSFTNFNSPVNNAMHIVKLNGNGAPAAGFNSGTGFDGSVSALALDASGNVFAGGDFINYNNTFQNRIAKLDSNGAVVSGFDPGARSVNNPVSTLIVDGSNILVGGAFNASIDMGANGFITAAVRQSNGQIVVGGSFTMMNGIARKYFARLNADGTLDLNFNSGTGFNLPVYALALDANDNIYVGGFFTNYNNTSQFRIAKLDNSGALATDFNSGNGFSNLVRTIAVDASGNIYVGGDFTSYNNTSQNRIAKLDSHGVPATDFSSGAGFNNPVSALAIDASGNIYAGGDFTTYNGSANNAVRIAKLDNHGVPVVNFNSGMGFNNSVNALAVDASGNLYAGGAFTSYNGPANNAMRIAKLDSTGAPVAGFNSGTGFNTFVSAFALDANGNVFAGGSFSTYNTTLQKGIAKLDSNGTPDVDFNSGTGFGGAIVSSTNQGSISTLAFNGGYIFAGGSFTSYNGSARNAIARLEAGLLPGLLVSKTSAAVSEAGLTESFTVSLASQPGSDVVLDLDYDDTQLVVTTPALPKQLRFTTTDWDFPQTVTISALNDAANEGPLVLDLTIVINVAGSADEYDQLSNRIISVSVEDNDVPGLSITPGSVSVSETGTTATFKVKLIAQPEGNVVLDLDSSDTGEVQITSPVSTTLTFTDQK